jgi:hypothetical protein
MWLKVATLRRWTIQAAFFWGLGGGLDSYGGYWLGVCRVGVCAVVPLCILTECQWLARIDGGLWVLGWVDSDELLRPMVEIGFFFFFGNGDSLGCLEVGSLIWSAVERLRMAGRGCIGMVVVMALEGEREREREREWRGGREGEGRINSSTFFFIQSSLAPLEYKPCLNRLMTKSH